MEKRKRGIQKKIRVTPEEDILIRENMKKSNRNNFSDYTRELLIKGEIKVIDFKVIKDLRWEVSKIGNNINQVVKKIHENRIISEDDIEKIINLQEQLEENISEIIKLEFKKGE